MGFPVNISKRAGPCQLTKLGDARLTKRTVKTRVVGNHHIHALQHGCDARLVQALALHLGIGDTGQSHDLFGNGPARVFQLIKHLQQAQRRAGGAVYLQAQHRQLNNFFFGLV